MSLLKQILDFRKGPKRLLFTTPTHSQGEFIENESKRFLGEKAFNCDYSEIEGFDNLRSPKTILRKLLDKFARIYKSKATFILTNGSSSGICAAMLTVLKENDKVLIARNCHVSVYNGLVLTSAKPIWVLPEYDQEWGIYKGLGAKDIKEAIDSNPDIKALILTSPTYEGIFSDIKEISEITKEKGIKLIVDEAHGALLNFGNFKTEPAILCGADISVNSLHKTAGGLTPSALLHLSQGSNIMPESIQDALNIINTTSPSYPLMLSVETTVTFLNSDNGKTYIRRLQRSITKLSKHLQKNPKLKIYEGFNDSTKILFKAQGLAGSQVSQYLNNEKNIEEEFSNTKSLLFITGLGTTKWKLFKLFYTLSKINLEPEKSIIDIFCNYKLPQQIMTPKEAFSDEKEMVMISDLAGRIVAEPVLNYPPGIPVVIPGEKIEESMLPFIEKDCLKVIK